MYLVSRSSKMPSNVCAHGISEFSQKLLFVVLSRAAFACFAAKMLTTRSTAVCVEAYNVYDVLFIKQYHDKCN